MVDDRLVQPRQIYASTLTRREHRARRRPRASSPLQLTVRIAAALCAALSVLAVVVPGVG